MRESALAAPVLLALAALAQAEVAPAYELPAYELAAYELAACELAACELAACELAACEDPARVRGAQDGATTGGVHAGPTQARGNESGEAERRALERGLDWLDATWRGSGGAFPALGARSASAGTGPAAEVGGYAPVATTALGALAWMAGGSAPERGPHGEACAQAVDWLAERAELDERSQRHGYVSQAGDALSRMHGHGFATLALAQADTMSPRTARGARVRAALSAAVRCIEASQGVEGGWYYDPKKGLAHESSITITAVQALRAAKEAGIDVERSVIARAVDYVTRTQKPDGSFTYALGDPTSSVALTAAAMATLNMTGTYTGKPLENGRDFLARRLALRAESGALEGDLIVCPFYERLYLAQALWQEPDTEAYRRWWREEARRVLATQWDDGSWSDRRFGDVYATAMQCLVLALPEGLLPIFQR